MDTWTCADTRIEKASETFLKILLCVKIIGRMDKWTHTDTRIKEGSEIFLKILLCVKSLDVWTHAVHNN